MATNKIKLSNGIKWDKSSIEATSFNPQLVWENASSTSSFSPTTLNVDLSGFNIIMIKSKSSTTGSSYHNDFCMIGDSILASMCVDTTFKIGSRSYTVSTDKIEVGGGHYSLMNYVSSESDDDSIMIPYKIYGIK